MVNTNIKPSVLIATEALPSKGLGHIARAVALAEAFLHKQFAVNFVVNSRSEISLLKPFRNVTYTYWSESKEEFLRSVSFHDVLILDSYIAGIETYNEAVNLSKVLLIIDDVARLNFQRGTVVNGAIAAETSSHLKQAYENCEQLLGANYAFLRSEFWTAPQKEIRKDIKDVFIAFGGDDPFGLSAKTVLLLNSIYPSVKKHVLVGQNCSTLSEIQEAADENTKIYCDATARQIFDILSCCDLAVSAGGQTLYELARLGVPLIAVAVYDNQMSNINGWISKQCVGYAGKFSTDDIFENLKNLLEKLQPAEIREQWSRRSQELVDGQGPFRIVDFTRKKLQLSPDSALDRTGDIV